MQLDRDICYRALLARDRRFDGRFFTAVRTTGIYCRPICPATPPKPEHVVFLPSAAAAQNAGYRPCLRCRPETSPEIGAWNGTWNTISRAMALIAAGALAESDVETLAGRLGIGARQLRRLFHHHLGASPHSIAAARRIDLAKRLITETSLPLGQIALASGYGSIRRFNDSFRRVFGHPPSSFRRSASARQPGSTAAITLTLPYKPPYDWAAMIGFLAARAIPGVESVRPDRYTRIITIGDTAGGDATGTLTVTHAPHADALIARIRFPDIAALPLIVERIRRMFDLGADPVLIDAHLSRDPDLARLVAAHPGLRVPGVWDGFEFSLRAVLGQQITLAAGVKLAHQLAAACGTQVPSNGDPEARDLTTSFPTAARVAAADPTKALAQALAIPDARLAAIKTLAEAACRDPNLFEPGRPLDQAIATIQSLPGLGPWSAHIIAMRALREPDAFPSTDVFLRRAMAGATQGKAKDAPHRPSPAALSARAEAWRPWRAYAALHLWTSGTSGAHPRTDQTPDQTHGPSPHPHRLTARPSPPGP